MLDPAPRRHPITSGTDSCSQVSFIEPHPEESGRAGSSPLTDHVESMTALMSVHTRHRHPSGHAPLADDDSVDRDTASMSRGRMYPRPADDRFSTMR